MLQHILGKERKEFKIIFILITLLLIVILAYPLYSVLNQAFYVNGSLSFANFANYLTQNKFYTALFNSFKISFSVAFIATCIAFISAYGLNFFNFNRKFSQMITIILLLPLFLPSITYGFAIIYSFGRQGLITRTFGHLPFSIYGFYGLLIAGVIYTLSPAFMILNNSFKYVDKNFIIVSKIMGDNQIKTFYMTAFRPVIGAIASAFILSFFLNFTDFGIPASIAGRYEVISITLYGTMMGAIPDFSNGSVIALVMLLPSIISVLILTYLDKLNFRYNKISSVNTSQNNTLKFIFYIFYCLIALALIATFLVMFIVPFVKSYPYQLYFTTETLKRVLSDSAIFNVYTNSLMVAVITAITGTILCYFAGMLNARSRLNSWCKKLLDFFAMVANTVPGMVLGIGFLFAFTGTSLMNTFLIIILANIVHFFTTPYLMAKQAFSRMNSSYEVTGELMGDSYFKTLCRIVIPNSYHTIIEMFSYLFINAMVTISAIIFLTGAKTMVTTSKIKELQYFEKFDAIFVLSLLIFLTNMLVKLLLDSYTCYLDKKSKSTKGK